MSWIAAASGLRADHERGIAFGATVDLSGHPFARTKGSIMPNPQGGQGQGGQGGKGGQTGQAGQGQGNSKPAPSVQPVRGGQGGGMGGQKGGGNR